MIKEIIELMMSLVQLAFVTGRQTAGLEETPEAADFAFWAWWESERPALWGMPDEVIDDGGENGDTTVEG